MNIIPANHSPRPVTISGRRLGWSLILTALLCRPGEAQKPNLLVILTDDQYFRGIGYNNTEVKTPNLDALAGEGTIFNRAYVASPICAASRAALMTGVYPQQHGVIALDNAPFKAYHDQGARAAQTLGANLSRAGYHTAFWGKSHLGDPTKYGFKEGKELGDITDSTTFAMAGDFLERASGSATPFFLWLAPHQPHVPLKPAPRWLNLYDEKTFSVDSNFREAPLRESIYNQGLPGEHFYRDSDFRNNWLSLSSGPPRTLDSIRLFKKAYYAAISHLDDQVGALVRQLKAKNLYEKTAILFLADNGYHLGTHGLGNKLTMHEESVRIPFYIRRPGSAANGKRANGLVSSLDVYPTLMELAGAPVPSHVMGKSLLPLLTNPDATVREVVFSEAVGIGGKAGQGQRMARGDAWKYVLTDINEQYLFDETADRWELRNRFPGTGPKAAAIARQLQAAAMNWMKAIGDRPFPYPTGLRPAAVSPARLADIRIRNRPEGLLLEIPGGGSAAIRLQGITGKPDFRGEARNSLVLPRSDFPAGVYLLRVGTGPETQARKVVISGG